MARRGDDMVSNKLHQSYNLDDDLDDDEVDRLIAEAEEKSLASSTRYQYEFRWRRFTADCECRSMMALPATPNTVLRYLARRSTNTRPKCVALDRAAIRRRHLDAELLDPTDTTNIERLMAGIRRKYGTRSTKKKALLTTSIRAICRHFDGSGGLIAMRDKAAILLGFSGALRSCEVVGRTIQDLEFYDDGLVICISQSKTDQEGKGARVAVSRGGSPETCPVLAVEEWLTALAEHAGVKALTTGILFPALRSYSGRVTVYDCPVGLNAYRNAIKQAVEAVGLDPKLYSGHSLRAGHATSAARAGALAQDIMKQGRWRSVEVLAGYIQEGRQFVDNSSNSLGL